MGKIKCVLLDCDNTLVQSERVAFEACAELINELLEAHGVGDRYTVDSLLDEFVGHNFRNMLMALDKKYNLGMDDREIEDHVARELGKVIEKLSAKCTECPGVTPALTRLQSLGYPMAVVSTSAKSRVVASLDKTGLLHFFGEDRVYSAATSLHPPSSKPDPAIYLHACAQLGYKPSECVTVEDSKSGATSGMRAGVAVIAYVGIYQLEEGEGRMKEMEKVLVEGCKAKSVMHDWKDVEKCLAEVETKM